MKKVTLTSILTSAALLLFLSAGSWAHMMGGPSTQQRMMGTTPPAPTTTGQQQSTTQPYGWPGYGMGPGMMGGMGPGMMGFGMGTGMMGYGRGACGMMGTGMMGFGMGRYGYLGLLKQSLDLSDEQLTTIYSTFAEARRDTIKKVAEIRIAQLDLMDMLRSPKVDMTAVKNKLKEIEGLRTELRLARIEKHEKVKAVLTPEQLEKFLTSYPWHLESGSMQQQ